MLLPITIDKLSTLSLQEQIAEQLRRLILEGLLVPGTRVPTSRELARQAGLSRNTVTLAYERLIGEGYLQTRPASGTFVAEVFSNPDLMPSATAARSRPGAVPRRPVVFSGRALPQQAIRPEFDFRLLAADPATFPTREWRRHILLALEHHNGRMGNPPPPAGEPKLRHAIARWLGAFRGIAATADDVLVVAGRQQAYNIAAQLLLRPGDGVVVEAPCHMNAALVFEAARAHLLPVAVDEWGIRPERLPSGATLAHLTPSHQSPVGGTLPLDRREAVLAWARLNGTTLLEDDIGCEFHYDGWQPPSLKSMDRDGLVIYCGGFSLTLGAGLRLGYMVLPPELATAALDAKTLLDNGCPWLEQAALANLMETGNYARHVAATRKLYQERRNHLIKALEDRFGPPWRGEVAIFGAEAGTHVGLRLPEFLPDAEIIQRGAAERGIALHTLPPSSFHAAADPRLSRRSLYLGYGALPAERIAAAIDQLAAVIENRLAASA